MVGPKMCIPQEKLQYQTAFSVSPILLHINNYLNNAPVAIIIVDQEPIDHQHYGLLLKIVINMMVF
jgi:hypothetical protein